MLRMSQGSSLGSMKKNRKVVGRVKKRERGCHPCGDSVSTTKDTGPGGEARGKGLG